MIHSSCFAFPRFVSATFGLLVLIELPALAQQTQVYTTSADFALGVPTNVNSTVVADQLQLDTLSAPPSSPFVMIPCSARGTILRIDAVSGVVLGEYRTAPQGLLTNPSRTSVDSKGNLWVGNRDENGLVGGVPKGSVMKIGVVIGGTRVDANGQPNPNGQYLKPPFLYSTAVDRDGDGLIRTSRGLGDILAWPNITDGVGGANGIVQDALDETILIYQRVDCEQVRHVSVDGNDDVWVGGYPSAAIQPFDKLDGNTGAILSNFLPTCGGHGGRYDKTTNVLWSTSLGETSILRYNIATQTGQCIPIGNPHGLTLDTNGFAWVAMFDLNSVAKFTPQGTLVAGFPKRSGGASFDRSLAVTPIDNNVWVGSSAGNDVTRLDNNGVLRKVILLGAQGSSPRGVSVDSNGKVWVANLNSDTAMRIDPNGDTDGLGKVDLTVPLGANAGPYGIGDFTANVPTTATQPNGNWTVIYDSGTPTTHFGHVSYTASVPANTSLDAEFRVADTMAALSTAIFQPVTNGQLLNGIFGRFMQVRVNFNRANPQITATPVLFDLTIDTLAPTSQDCRPGQRNPGSLLIFPEFDNTSGNLTLLSVTNTARSGTDIKTEFVYVGRYDAQDHPVDCLEVNRTEALTPNDTLTLITSTHAPTTHRGFVYVFAKDKVSGKAIVYDHLIGQALAIHGISTVDYSFNAEVFLGIGNEFDETDHDGDGLRDLNNIEYSCAPDVILIPRFIGQSMTTTSQLVLLNLTGGGAFTATVDIVLYNDNEEPFSAQTSFQCWTKLPLHDISGAFDNAFLLTTGQNPNENIGVETGWFKLNGNIANSTAASFADPAILALLIEQNRGGAACDLPFETGGQTNASLYPLGVLGDTTP